MIADFGTEGIPRRLSPRLLSVKPRSPKAGAFSWSATEVTVAAERV
jgi:hypothetical protein